MGAGDVAVTAKAVQAAVAEYLRENYAPLQPLPDGLRLEMHPEVYYTIFQDPATAAWGDISSQAGLKKNFKVPVRVTTDVRAGTWRLVIVTEDVLLGGTL